jgi:four helix bundle protein
MATVKRFEDLQCWQEARKFVKAVYELTGHERFKKDFVLVGQTKRSSVSTMANIAEGFHRTSKKDFMKFLDYARSSLAETISHLYVAFDQDYITDLELNKAREQANSVWKMINNFITYLNNSTKTEQQSTSVTDATKKPT